MNTRKQEWKELQKYTGINYFTYKLIKKYQINPTMKVGIHNCIIYHMK